MTTPSCAIKPGALHPGNCEVCGLGPCTKKTAPMTEAEYRAANPGRPRIYDMDTETFRDATQADLDNYGAVVHAYGRLRTEFKAAQDELMGSLKK